MLTHIRNTTAPVKRFGFFSIALTQRMRQPQSRKSCYFLLGSVCLAGSLTGAFGQGTPLKISAPTPAPPPQIQAKSFTVFSDYGEGNAIANSLRTSPPKLYKFDRASLRDVLRFLADDAGIPFISMQERIPSERSAGAPSIDDILVTFTMRASPFLVLESIAKANDVALIYDNGVWFIRPYNERELIGRIYRLKFTPQDRVIIQTNNNTTGNQQNTNINSSAAVPNVQLQQPQSIFTTEEPALIQEIKNLLKIPSSGVSGLVAPQDASVDNFPPISSNSGLNPSGSNLSIAAAPPANEPSVTFNSDTNTIYIIATRQQHQWVEGFLAAADRPQALIGIEVKFFETTRDPSKEVGINWAATMQGGYDINLSQELVADGGIGYGVNNTREQGFNNSTGNGFNNTTTFRDTGRFGSESGSGTSGPTTPGNLAGVATSGNYDFNADGSFRNRTAIGESLNTTFDNASNLTTDIYESLRNYNSGLGAAYTAVLSPKDISFAIEAFMEDRDASIVQYPRVLTVNNREVAISNARNEPILGSSATNASGGASTETNSIEYLPIGTQLNILPKTMPDGSVFMNVAITVSNILRFKPIQTGIGQTNEYPVTTSRVYQAALQVDSGYTLAVGGLEETFDEQVDNGILLLKDIPGVGQLFKSKGRAQNRRNLIIFITPDVIVDRRASTGIAETPQSVLPLRPGDPTPPAFASDGRLAGGYTGLADAFAWLAFQNDFYRQIISENRTNRNSIKQLEAVIRTAEMVIVEIEFLAANSPARAEQFAKKEAEAVALLTQLQETLTKSQANLF
jgi:type II secretory pathway component GspD/PulD (secretin)